MKSGAKKIFDIIKTVFVWLVVIFSVLMMIFTVVSVSTFDKNDRQIFGYKMYIVKSDSMAATDFDAGALILVKEVNPATLQEGDIITFMSQDSSSFGETVTHKIRKLTVDAAGNPGFITYGTTTGVNDETIVTYPYILGKYQTNIPWLGHFFNFMRTPTGYFTCIFIPIVLLILMEGTRFFKLFRRYKREQMEEMQAERDKIAEEREANEKMLEELRQLKAQMESMQAAQTPPAAPAETAEPVEPVAETDSE